MKLSRIILFILLLVIGAGTFIYLNPQMAPESIQIEKVQSFVRTTYSRIAESINQENSPVGEFVQSMKNAVYRGRITGEIKTKGLTAEDARKVAEKGFWQIRENPSNLDALKEGKFMADVAMQLKPDEPFIYLTEAAYQIVKAYQSIPLQDKRGYYLNLMNGAELQIKKALSLDPKLGMAHLVGGSVNLMKNELKQARTNLNKAKKLSEDQFDYWYLEGVYRQKSNQSAEAADFFEEAEKRIHRPFQRALLSHQRKAIEKKQIHSRKGEKSTAIMTGLEPESRQGDFDFAVFLVPGAPATKAPEPTADSKIKEETKPLSENVSVASRKNKVEKKDHQDVEKKIEQYKKSLSSNPNDTLTALQLARIYDEKKQWKQAEDLLNNSLTKADDPAPFHFALGKVYENQRKTKEALDHYLKAYQLQPGNWNYAYRLGKTYLNEGETDSSIKYLKISEGKSPKPEDIYWALSIAYCDKGEPEEARDYYLKIMKMKHPNVNSAALYLGDHCPGVNTDALVLKTVQ